VNRRGFLGSILALGAAPAIVRADSLMRVVPPTSSARIGFWGNCAVELEVTDVYQALQEDFATQTAKRMAMLRELTAYNIIRAEHKADTIHYRGEVITLQ
jgi:hypothetical protein